MASFADSISQFNPYIQQLPVEAMTQVGMYKQQKYDEGIQKVQSYIDNVAGLEVVKPLQKAYLQSKLNELGSKLKTVAAGDFSNYQLVNSVGGMATQIAKDPTIQSAVLSTQKIKRGEQDLDAARKAGKNSIQNEACWNKTTNDWMSDGSLDSSFNGRYVEYRDMEEKLRGVAKDVHEYDNSIEVPYIRNNQGKTLYFYTDEATKKETRKKVAQPVIKAEANPIPVTVIPVAAKKPAPEESYIPEEVHIKEVVILQNTTRENAVKILKDRFLKYGRPS